MHAFLLIKIIDYRRVPAGEIFEAVFPARIGQPPAIENASAAVSGLVFRHALMK